MTTRTMTLRRPLLLPLVITLLTMMHQGIHGFNSPLPCTTFLVGRSAAARANPSCSSSSTTTTTTSTTRLNSFSPFGASHDNEEDEEDDFSSSDDQTHIHSDSYHHQYQDSLSRRLFRSFGRGGGNGGSANGNNEQRGHMDPDIRQFMRDKNSDKDDFVGQTETDAQQEQQEEVDDNEDEYEEWTDRRIVEFMNLEPLAAFSAKRQSRLQQQEQAKEQFATGNALWELRLQMQELSVQLAQLQQQAHADKNNKHIMSKKEMQLREQLRALASRDADLQYAIHLEAFQKTHDDRHYQAALAARDVLPQFQLEGLWVGKYGPAGYELINVTYVGDVLYATKVTGDQNVPKGQVSFTVDLTPPKSRDSSSSSTSSKDHGMHSNSASPSSSSSSSKTNNNGPLKPILLSERAAKQWGTKQLARHAGKGQVANKNHGNPTWIPGQLILISPEYFSFAWIPLQQQIFFARPSPELVLKMLRSRENSVAMATTPKTKQQLQLQQTKQVDDNRAVLQTQKLLLAKCLEKTHEYQDEWSVDADPTASCIWHGMDDTAETAFQ